MIQFAPMVIALVVFLAVIGISLSIYAGILSARSRRLDERLTGPSNRARLPGNRGQQAWLTHMASGGQRIDQLLDNPEETTILLAQAGWRGLRAKALFYAIQALLPLGMLIAAVPLWLALNQLLQPLLAIGAVAGAVILSLLLPRMVLRSVAKRRRERIRAEVPLFINLIILLFEAGLNTRQALGSLVQDGGSTLRELSHELRPVLRQIEAGGETGSLLLEMSKTLDVPELESVLGILRQVERYGGEIREPLTDALDNIESRRTMDLREQVNVMSGKMTVVLVACFFPALMVFIVGPAFASIFRAIGDVTGGG